MNTSDLLTVIINLLDQHLWLGYFINIFIKSTSILIIVLCLNLILKNYSAAARHLIWNVALLGLLLLPILVAVTPKVSITIPTLKFNLVSGIKIESLNENAQLLSNSINQWSLFIQATYFLIVFALIAYTFLGIIRIYLLTKQAKPLCCEEQLNALTDIVEKEFLFKKITILESSSLLSPVSWGLNNPTIILPKQAQTWSTEKIRNVLIHEVCHIQRLDWLSHILIRVVSAMYWCNPLIWLAVRKLKEEAEQACDDAVILYGRSQTQYAEDLLDISKAINHKHILAEAIAHSFLGARITSILDNSKTRQRTDCLWVMRAALASLTILIVFSSLKIVPEVKITVINRAMSNIATFNFPRTENTQRTSIPIVSTDVIKPVKNELVYVTNLPTPEQLPFELSTQINHEFNLVTITKDATLLTTNLDPPNAPENRNQLINTVLKVAPNYPERAKDKNIEGYSIIEYEISPNGEVLNPIVIESSPGSIFNQASLNAIEEYEFEPLILNGASIGIDGVRTRFIFQLNPKPG